MEDPTRTTETLSPDADLTEPGHAPEEIRNSLSLLKAAIESTADGLLIVSNAGTVTRLNKKFLTMWRIPESLALVRNDRLLLDHVLDQLKEPQQFLDKVMQLYNDPDAQTMDLLEFKDGRCFERYSQPQKIGSETVGRVWSFRDITDRKQAEEKVRQSEQFIRNILDTVDEGFIVIDRDFRILTANKSYCHLVGQAGAELIGRKCFELANQIKRPCFEGRGDCAVRDVFATGKPRTWRQKHPSPDGQVLHVEMKAYPIRDAAGLITSVIETISDITEKQLLEEERLKTQKLESIGILAGGVAHDFNNLLQGIFGYIAMAKITLDQKDKALAMLEQAEKALHQSVNLTTQLLTFAKGGKPIKQTLALPPVIENAVKFALSGSRTDFRLEIDPLLWRVNGDAGQLGQVIQNIVLNADQAMPLGGVVKISARNVAAGDSALPAALAGGDCLELVIEDSGIGIPEQYLDRIFDPYFTTKEKGSGLGLASSYAIIRNHDGRIRIASEVGKGTAFTLYLPARHDLPEAAGDEVASPFVMPQARILVMDDEELIRHLATDLLQELGDEVEVAVNGAAALAQYQAASAAGRPFDMVILDLTIRGGMGGLETLRHLLAFDPGVRAVVSSGYSDDAVLADYRGHGFKAFLKKPYKIQELRSVMHRLLVK